MKRFAGAVLAAALTAVNVPLPVAARPTAPPRSAPAAAADTETLVGVKLNGEEFSTGTFVLLHDNDVYVSKDDLVSWGLRVLPTAIPYERNGKEYYSLSVFSGLKYAIEQTSQSLLLTGSPSLFAGTVLNLRNRGPAITSQDRGAGGYLNYSLFARGPQQGPPSGAFDLGLSLPHGVWHYSFYDKSFPFGAVRRLETAYESDDLHNRTTFKLGDAFSMGGFLATPARFVGVQWASNFAVDPTFVPYPVPAFFGNVPIDATLDIRVNNARRANADLQPGPFSVQNIPLVDGAGQVELLITDALGHERIIVANYYQSRTLLAKGVTSHSLNAGFERSFYGGRSGHYGPLFLQGFVRRGLTEKVTAELHAEHTAGVGDVIGADVDFVPGHYGVFSIGFAKSDGALGVGTRSILGYSYAGRLFDVGVQDDRTTPSFHEVGSDLPEQLNTPGRNHLLGHLGIRLNRSTSLSFASTTTTSYVAADPSAPLLIDSGNINHYTSISLTKSIGRRRLIASWYRISGNANAGGAFVRYMLPMGQREQATFNLDTQSGAPASPIVQLAHQGKADDLTGAESDYAMDYGSQEGQRYFNYAISSRTSHGELVAGLTALNSTLDWQLDATGGVVFEGGRAFRTREIVESYGIVKVGYPNVRVYSSHRYLGTTGSDGNLVVGDLMPYFGNEISVDQRDLPMSVIADKSVTVSPMLRGGAVIKIPTHVEHSVLVTLVDKDGKPLVAGTVLRDAADAKRQWPVAEDGVAFLSPVTSSEMDLVADDGLSKCQARVLLPQQIVVEGANIGNVTCLPVANAAGAGKLHE